MAGASGKETADENIQVFVRLRPPTVGERAQYKSCSIFPSVAEAVTEKRQIVVRDSLKPDVPSRTYTFDRVFGERSSQQDIYKHVVEPLVEQVIHGYNCTVFAYGQTGTGKTFTMVGEQLEQSLAPLKADDGASGDTAPRLFVSTNPYAGMIPRAIRQLFIRLAPSRVGLPVMMTASGALPSVPVVPSPTDTPGGHSRAASTASNAAAGGSGECELLSVKVSFFEIYNEQLFDLLTDDKQRREELRIYDDSDKKVVVSGLRETLVTSEDEVYTLLLEGAARRRTACTQLNDRSSRSHSVFQIVVTMKEKDASADGEDVIKVGKLFLVDLAGSENIGRSGAVDKRAAEAGNINQSLLTLGRVINSLVEKNRYVPYRSKSCNRDSKLTRILKDSLGGNTKTSIIATISPSPSNYEETQNTLDYALRATKITNTPQVNARLSRKEMINDLTDNIERLKRDLESTRTGTGFFVDKRNYTEMQAELQNYKTQYSIQCQKYEESRKEFETLNDQFRITQDERDQLASSLNAVTADLALVRDELARRIELLDRTARELREERFLVTAHSRYETRFENDSRQVLNTAIDSVHDVDQLHNRVQRATTSEKENRSARSAFVRELEAFISNSVSNHGTRFQKLRNEIGQLSEAFGTFSDELHTSIEKECLPVVSSMSTLCTELLAQNLSAEREFVRVLAEKDSSLLSHFEQYTIKQCESLKLLVENTKELMTGIFTRLRSAASERSIQLSTKLFELTTGLIQANDESASALQEELKQLGQRLRDHFDHSLEEIEQLQRQFNDLESALISKEQASTKTLLGFIESFQHDLNSRFELFTANLSNHSAEMHSSSQKSRGLFANSIENTFDSARATSQASKDDVKRFEDMSQQRTEEASELAASVARSHKDAVASFTSGLEAELEQGSNKLESGITDTVSRVERISSETSSLFEVVSQTVQSSRSNADKHLASFSENNSAMSDQIEASLSKKLKGVFAEMAARAKQSTQRFNALAGSTDQHAAETSDEISIGWREMGNRVSTFFAEGQRDYVPTGMTPSRRAFEFPRDLPRLLPDSDLRELYREGRGDDELSCLATSTRQSAAGLPAADVMSGSLNSLSTTDSNAPSHRASIEAPQAFRLKNPSRNSSSSPERNNPIRALSANIKGKLALDADEQLENAHPPLKNKPPVSTKISQRAPIVSKAVLKVANSTSIKSKDSFDEQHKKASGDMTDGLPVRATLKPSSSKTNLACGTASGSKNAKHQPTAEAVAAARRVAQLQNSAKFVRPGLCRKSISMTNLALLGVSSMKQPQTPGTPGKSRQAGMSPSRARLPVRD